MIRSSLQHVHEGRASTRLQMDRSQPRPAPSWMVLALWAAVFWALAYTAVRVWWAVEGTSPFGQPHADLVVFTGWGAVALSAAAAGVAIALKSAPWWRPLFVAAWVASTALVLASAMLLLDVVAGLLPGLGVQFQPVGFGSRAACAFEGLLLATSAVAYRRRCRSDCLYCGRMGSRVRPTRIPSWAWLAAYAAVAGCLVRLGAQVAVGFEGLLLQLSVSLLLFETGFVLAGTVLPLALVHSWGRVFPRWVPVLAGRKVPRWLILGAGFGIGGAMTGYFGLTLLTLTASTLTGTSGEMTATLPLAFFWVAVPSYFVWGLGLITAAIAYYRITRPRCRVCGQ